MNPGEIRKVAIVGSFVPRRCGIATFTSDLANAVSTTGVEVEVVAVNDRVEGYQYPEVVKIQIDQHRPESYDDAAVSLNRTGFDLICVEHEFGIYGGPAGSHLLRFLRDVNAPIVTTLHTILENPDADQTDVIDELSYLSELLIVMSDRGKRMLNEVHGIHPDKVRVIPHGIPSLERRQCEPYLADLGLAGRKLILTFGLIAPDKGIEYMISAMPAICAKHPEAYYLIVGVTHPNVRAAHGEQYRQSLIDLVAELGMGSNVGFVDEFVSLDELGDFLMAAEIYVTPYLKKEQITSGTLAYAYGSGKAVVSTPYWHADELLADGRGLMVPYRDSAALAKEVCKLLSDPELLKAIQMRAYTDGQLMRWPAVASAYAEAFTDAQDQARSVLPKVAFSPDSNSDGSPMTFQFCLDHLRKMTDDTGILQHSTYSIPNRFEGYCTDDNARLAILGARLMPHSDDPGLALDLQHKGLSFLHHAFNESNGRMRNFLTYSRTWNEEVGSEDSHGRAIWALGVLLDESTHANIRAVAKDLFIKALPASETFLSNRGMAFTILGLDRALATEYSNEWLSAVTVLGNRLFDAYKSSSSPEWQWFEDIVCYDNARLPQALISAGCVLENDQMIAAGKVALGWLNGIQSSNLDCFMPIGSNGFYPRGGTRAIYDQQPLESAATIEACCEVYRLTGESAWRDETWKAYRWFLGGNIEAKSLIDSENGGCKDGLMEGGVNQNQGAESTIAFITSCLNMKIVEAIASRRGSRYLS